jgi:hypothetical protein
MKPRDEPAASRMRDALHIQFPCARCSKLITSRIQNSCSSLQNPHTCRAHQWALILEHLPGNKLCDTYWQCRLHRWLRPWSTPSSLLAFCKPSRRNSPDQPAVLSSTSAQSTCWRRAIGWQIKESWKRPQGPSSLTTASILSLGRDDPRTTGTDATSPAQ